MYNIFVNICNNSMYNNITRLFKGNALLKSTHPVIIYVRNHYLPFYIFKTAAIFFARTISIKSPPSRKMAAGNPSVS